MFDLKIVNGTIVDGTGAARFQADLAINGEKIVAIGDLKNEDAKVTIDATGKMVSPGFIDFHTHSDLSILYDKYSRARIHSGVTTDVVANCGIGVAPIRDSRKDELIKYLSTRIIGTIPAPLELHWNTMEEYFDYVEKSTTAVNIVAYCAQGPVRIDEMGFAKGDATPEQLEHMKAEVAKAMEAGCIGLTTGLVYLPGSYTSKEELAELCSAMKPYGGFYCTHMRDEGDGVLDAIDEAIYIAKTAGVPLHISHLKVMGEKNFGTIDKVFEKINNARAEGLDVTFDAYPYNAGMSSLGTLLPTWTFEGGVDKMLERIQIPENQERIKREMQEGIPGWQSFYIMTGGFKGIVLCSVMTEANKKYEGMNVLEVAADRGVDPFQAFFDLLVEEKSKIQMLNLSMSQDDVDQVIADPDGMIGSDSMDLSDEGLLSIGKPHPRAFGTVGKLFATYVREKGVLTFEQAVRKLTGLPAKRIGFTDRGILKEGNFADIVVFDPETIADTATYTHPQQYPTGIDTVIVNGQIAFHDGKQLDVCAGKMLRKGKTF